MENVLLTDDEYKVVEEYRKAIAYTKAEEQFKADALFQALHFRTWLKTNNKNMHYASYRECFDYKINESHNLYIAVVDILDAVEKINLKVCSA